MNEDRNQIADAIIKAACYLGNGDAMTSMGAIEALGVVHKEGMQEIAEAHREGLESIADALIHIAVSIDGLTRVIEKKE
jgi:hypothetical protein